VQVGLVTQIESRGIHPLSSN